MAWSVTHGELAVFVVDFLLQRSLWTSLSKVQADDAWVQTWYSIMASRISSASPVNVSASLELLKTALAVLCSAKGSRLRKICSSFLETQHQDQILAFVPENYRPSVFLRSLSLISPSGTGVLSDSARTSTRRIRDFIDSRFAAVRWIELQEQEMSNVW